MARKAFATSFEKAAAENSAGRGALFFEGQSSKPQRKARVYVFYRTSKEALSTDHLIPLVQGPFRNSAQNQIGTRWDLIRSRTLLTTQSKSDSASCREKQYLHKQSKRCKC